MALTVYHKDGRILNIPGSKLDAFIEKGFSLDKPQKVQTESPKVGLKRVTK